MTAVSLTYEGDGRFVASNAGHKRRCDDAFGVGEVVTFERLEKGHSLSSHRRYFKGINLAWQNLPDHVAMEAYATSADDLRKHALIMTGWRKNAGTMVFASRAEAIRAVPMLKAAWKEYALASMKDATVTIFTAKSQSMKAMGRADFEQSKNDVTQWVSDLIGVHVEALLAEARIATDRSAA